MHQRFSLKATLRSDLSDVYQFTFHNQLELVTYFFEQTELNATVCHFADIISLRRRHNSLGPVRAGDESIILIEGEFKHEVRQFQKPYDNQQAEQISLMV